MTHDEQVALIQRVLNDREWTTRVVVAAVAASSALHGPIPTADGDDPATVARSYLRTALLDQDAITAALDWRAR